MIRLPNINTRFALPIIHPVTGETVSAETLYNDVCAAEGYQVRDYIGDLILDNFDYAAGAHDATALCAAVYAWAKSVRAGIDAQPEDTAVFCFTNSSDARVIVYGAKCGFSSPSDCIWMIPGTWQIWPKSH